MYAKKPRYRLTVLIMVLMLVLGSAIGTVAAKYVYQETMTATVVFSAELAESFELKERRANRTANGDYTLGEDTVEANTYILMPGVDIPKDPHVVIKGKTPIASYLYMEVVENLNTAITYEHDATIWKPLIGAGDNQISGPKGGKIYVYTGGDETAKKIEAGFPEDPIYLLSGGKDAMVTVSQSLLEKDSEKENEALTFYAYLYEIGKTDEVEWSAAETFINNQTTTP